MARCKWCGKKFNRDEANEKFESIDNEYNYLSYWFFKPKLCYDCAVEAIDDLVDGVYFDDCEECGQTFDFIVDQAEYNSHFSPYNGYSFVDCWNDANQVLCAACAIEYAESD